MTSFETAYTEKRMNADEAVALIKSGENIAMGMALSEPPALLAALARRLEARAVSGLKLWYFHSMPGAAETVLRYELLDRIQPHCMFMGPIERELAKRGEVEGRKVVNFVPVAFSDAPALFERHVDLDTCLVVVSPMDRHGYFSFGTNNDYASTAARTAKHTIVEVNPQMPRVFGDSMIHISEIDALIEHDVALHEVPTKEPSEADHKIAKIVADMVPDGACLQMGIGALPGIVCEHLKSRHDLGIHTELLSPGLVELIDCGAVTNRRKNTFPGRTVFTFALGNKRMYDLIDDNPAVNSHPVNIVNDPRHIAKNPGVISINATLEVDLTGACNSESLKGRQYSGSGGQLDFVRGARASKGGRSIIATRSTTRDGKVSRIVPELTGAVTTPRNDVDTIVTEFGAARLIGLSAEERAEALIGLAHPDHREDLRLAARQRALID
ncbi:acetyl-CoA hydrolase/transferase C-terminal domain-containing protein [Hyphomonas sp. FCG-A18]|uniref:acetyl-CoA hydrolase/transferase family protein n=1 Tax=Hyphomonas sp. FCG-A18 TaxID=3080019 RepID=UPI002B2DA812|nr:acetyl-CoA hydrolase/transferase C-terminal domain-containing protein [Hyphomonas sp. FCG-A18]